MKQNYTKIVFVIDRSGSMSNIAKDMEGGLETFISEQKKNNLGQCDVSIYQFDDHYDVVYENVDINQAPKYSLTPRGSTAMLDAVGRTINSVGETLSKMKEEDRPDRVLFVIITDGYENASKEFKDHQVKDLIKQQTEQYNWTFTYLGANQDAWAVGTSLGMDQSKILKYAADQMGTQNAWKSLDCNVKRYRASSCGGAVAAQNFAFSEEDIKNAFSEGKVK